MVDTAKCTMCLSCVGACPEGALADNPERPQLRFIEKNCVQCGLCATTCPEDAITLEPRLWLADDGKARKTARVLHEVEPFRCVRCGKPFGTLRAIEAMIGKLAGHAAFQGAGRRAPEDVRRLPRDRHAQQSERSAHHRPVSDARAMSDRRSLHFASADGSEELARAELYGLLAQLWLAPPDAALLQQFEVAVTQAPQAGGASRGAVAGARRRDARHHAARPPLPNTTRCSRRRQARGLSSTARTT